MFKLAHLSDPHLGPLPQPTIFQLASKRILGYLNWQINRKNNLTSKYLEQLVEDIHNQNPDHTVVTGDLVNLSLPIEFKNSLNWLNQLGRPEDVSIIPGNHDAYVPGALKKAKQEWNEYLVGDYNSSGSIEFPYCRIRKNIAIIGTSSAIATAPFMATGRVGFKQLARLTQLLDELSQGNYFRIILIHHPPYRNATSWYKSLLDFHNFKNTIKIAGAELILHGHTHNTGYSTIELENKYIPIVGVPSASKAPNGKYPSARYNLFSIDYDGKDWSCDMVERGFCEKKDKIVKISQKKLNSAKPAP